MKPRPFILKIAEAQTKDASRAIGRIDPEKFSQIQANIGDILKLKSIKGVSAVKLLPTYPEMRRRGIIQIDGIARENLGVGVGEEIEICKSNSIDAKTVILTPLDSRVIFKEEDGKYLAEILDGTPVLKQNKIRVNLFGAKTQDFLVEHSDPEGIVIIRPSTVIQIKGEAKSKRSIGTTYEDIGGFHKELKRIREMIELPLKYPELFERLGINPPKGVLLHGPPGCGKTLIARAIAHETNAYFTHISGPEIMGKFYGESEGSLRNIFEEAQANAPSLIFIDEIDAIAPKREDLGGEKQVERRVVAQLLALMDGLKSRGNIIVIGATNIPNSLDSALRRPGRFDREIALGVPDRRAREEILEIYTRGMPLAENVNLSELAEITHGFVGADLEALAREAAMSALRKILPELDFEKERIPYHELLEIKVTKDHFLEALQEVAPSALREVAVEIPNTKWDDVGGLDHIKQILKETIEWPLKYGSIFDCIKLSPPKGILLSGRPGCGKTLLARAVATELGVNFISVKGPQFLSKYIGESEMKLREIFKKARMCSPCIIFFDEMDSLAPKRKDDSDSHVTDRIVSQFLVELDGIESLKGVVVLGATNKLNMIDPALLRAGRFDFLLEVPDPDEKSRHAIFKIHTRGKPLDRNVDLKKLAKLTAGLTGSDIEFICKMASMSTLRKYINAEQTREHKNIRFEISLKDFEEVLSSYKKDSKGT